MQTFLSWLSLLATGTGNRNAYNCVYFDGVIWWAMAFQPTDLTLLYAVLRDSSFQWQSPVWTTNSKRSVYIELYTHLSRDMTSYSHSMRGCTHTHTFVHVHVHANTKLPATPPEHPSHPPPLPSPHLLSTPLLLLLLLLPPLPSPPLPCSYVHTCSGFCLRSSDCRRCRSRR